MQVFRSFEQVPDDFGPAVVSVGNFDGVHAAHREVLARVVSRARETAGRAVAVTFEPHPMRVLRPDLAPRLITTPAVKLRLLAETGIDAVLLLPFTRDLSLMQPREFATEVLCRRLHTREVHEGFNFHFGHRAQGDVEMLKAMGAELGFAVVVYEAQRMRGDVVSSSRIRELIAAGKVARANRLLGRCFSIVSNAGRGRGYGHRFTVPTINLTRYDELTPRDGVYVTCTRVGQERFQSVTNIGTRPTFGTESFAIETHLLNFHPVEVNSETEIEIGFLYRLRDEQKFPSVEALREQITRDVRRATHYFALRHTA
ncbi:MAG TPA: bifunctional riboflavin kinase/FAD synthetase [Terriglobales bacterium]|nr:bifunctional riboflavin kinase/FAD synthetase [Terriglobales bacterium]